MCVLCAEIEYWCLEALAVLETLQSRYKALGICAFAQEQKSLISQ